MLRQAHTAQQQLVMDLQESVGKARQFRGVIEKQEKIIGGLETALRETDSANVGKLREDRQLYNSVIEQNILREACNRNLAADVKLQVG